MNQSIRWQVGMMVLCMLFLAQYAQAEEGVTDNEIIIGGVMDLEGRSSGLGKGMKEGIEAAFKEEKVAGKKIRLITENDSYTPSKTIEATQKLANDGVLLFMGNVGTPTAKVSLPILADKSIPAFGFFTGAGLLRPGKGEIVNFRASYVQEVSAVIRAALQRGVKPTEVCAYVQNDAYGMAGVAGIRAALKDEQGTDEIRTILADIIAKEGAKPERDNLGPVGVYTRNTFVARNGYLSLKQWESKRSVNCKLVVTVGTYEAIARFIAYAVGKGEKWIFSAVSFTGADNFLTVLDNFGVSERVIMTQVVPFYRDDLPIVQEAKEALGDSYGYVTLEGFIVGRLLLRGLKRLEEKGKAITRSNVLTEFRDRSFDLGGLPMDFLNDNQGSDLVELTALSDGSWSSVRQSMWDAWSE